MKRRDLLKLAPAAVLAGCAGVGLKLNNLDSASLLAQMAVEALATPIGFWAAEAPDLDLALRNVYNLAKEGKLTTEGMNRVLAEITAKDPLAILMIKKMIRMAELVGAQVNPDGLSISDLTGMDPKLLEAVKRGYVDGYDAAMIAKSRAQAKA